ncbi:Dehydrogenase/reductase SDR member 7 [Porites harrisoni]
MPTERCARLMVVSMANNLDEVWITEYPILTAPYFNQYFPNFFRWGVKKIAMKGTRELLDLPQDKDA